MKKKIIVGVLMGAMMLTLFGCKKDEKPGESEKNTPKPTKAEESVESTKAPDIQEKDLFEYIDDFYGYSFKMPIYSRRDYEGSSFVQENKVYNSMGNPATEKYVAVFRYIELSHKDVIDISKINSVYDIHENMAEYAFDSTMYAMNSWDLVGYDIKVEDKAEVINGYEMLKFEGTLDKEVDETETLGITGYYIFAKGLPIVVMGVDCSDTVYGRDYGGTLTLLDSIREEVEAMVHTFSTEGWTRREIK
jgi:hypothetical protein